MCGGRRGQLRGVEAGWLGPAHCIRPEGSLSGLLSRWFCFSPLVSDALNISQAFPNGTPAK